MIHFPLIRRLFLFTLLYVISTQSGLCIELLAEESALKNTDKEKAIIRIVNYAIPIDDFEPYRSSDQRAQMFGSGFFISPDGLIITNWHVVAHSVGLYAEIPYLGQKPYQLKFIGGDPDLDIALLKLEQKAHDDLKKELEKKGISTIPYLQFGNSETLRRGDQISVFGYPLSGNVNNLKFSQGHIAGLEDGWLQITAPINPGNSGGPVFYNNEVIGVACSKMTGTDVDNIGFIIPAFFINQILTHLHTSSVFRKPILGLSLYQTTEASYLKRSQENKAYHHGLRIFKVLPGTIADNLGLKKGDIICELQGLNIDNKGFVDVPWWDEKVPLSVVLSRISDGDKVSFKILRGNKVIEKNFVFTYKNQCIPAITTLHSPYEKHDFEVLGGMVLVPLSLNILFKDGKIACPIELLTYLKQENMLKPQLIISHVHPNSEAQNAGIYTGLVIKTINGTPVNTLEQFRNAIRKTTGEVIEITFDNDMIADLSIETILDKEDQLSLLYRFVKSPLIQALEHRK